MFNKVSLLFAIPLIFTDNSLSLNSKEDIFVPDGIELKIVHYCEYADNNSDNALYLRKTSGQVGSNYASATLWSDLVGQTFTYGGATDKWGTTWSVEDINSSDFGCDFSIDCANSSRTGYVDYIEIRIYYTAGTGGGTNLQVQVGDVFRPVSEIHVNVNDVWRPATAFVNVGDVWRA